MTRKELRSKILEKKSFLCVGLDSDFSKIPAHLMTFEDPVFEFNKQIIDATHDLCVAYKPNLAFYEVQGAAGWHSLQRTIDYIPNGHFIIADAKRGDIGNTSKQYAKAFFETLGADALTIAPYMGEDSVTPFLGFPEKWVILLGLTSNRGSADFQTEAMQNGRQLFKQVLEKAATWGSPENLMFVIGATHPEKFREIRKIVPNHFLLVPGIGAQGGSLKEVAEHGLNGDVGLLVNASRSIIFAGDGIDFAQKARKAALEVQKQMEEILSAGDF